MKALFLTLFFSPAILLAHSGHPGAATHGDATHILVGLLVALPIPLLLLGLKVRKHSAAKVRKQD